MSEVTILKLHIENLPVLMELCGENGEKEIYEIKPAGRKFGALLNKVNHSVRNFFSK